MKHFKVCFEVPQSKLETMVGLLTQEVSNLNITEVAGNNGGVRRRKKAHKGGTRATKDTRLGQFVLGLMSDGKNVNVSQLRPAVKKEGFAATSTDSTMSALFKEGVVERVTKGVYKRVA